MGTEQVVDYEAVLADAEAKRAFWDSVVAIVKQIIGQGGEATSFALPFKPAPTVPSLLARGEVRPDSFLGMTVVVAIKKYLQMAGSKQTTEQIADALLKGG